MDELRFVRREERSLVVANDAGDEFALVVDDTVLSELKHLSRRERDTSKVRPREIQALIRAGKTRSQVVAETGLDEADIERYEEPVLAERRYVLERAHAVAVRTDAHADDDQRFGAVIAERLLSLGCDTSEWSSWKDPESGWMVALEFISRDVAHRAVWSFDHRKGLLSPITPDAINLSKQGDVGDRLIPKLRAVDNGEQSGRFDAAAFDAAAPADGADPDAVATDRGAEPDRSGMSEEKPDANAEYARRREIDQRAIKSESAPSDLNQTADLLDALRKRRGERDRNRGGSDARTDAAPETLAPEPLDATAPQPPVSAPQDAAPSERRPSVPRSIWGAAGVSSGAKRGTAPSETATPDEDAAGGASEQTAQPSPAAEEDRGSKKGRASIPSWDDILFGTRSDEDPA